MRQLVQRIQSTLTGQAERAILLKLCQVMPAVVTSDMLTLFGLLGAGMIFVAFCLAHISPAFYTLAIFGLFANWFGDSLDGSLARYRDEERPQYGFFLDHTCDGFAMALVATGIGLSPVVHFWCAMLGLMGYYLITILSLTTCLATGVFRVSFARIGPTEIRLVIVIATIFALFAPLWRTTIMTCSLTAYDISILLLTAAMVLTALAETLKTAGELSIIDPPRRERQSKQHFPDGPHAKAD